MKAWGFFNGEGARPCGDGAGRRQAPRWERPRRSWTCAREPFDSIDLASSSISAASPKATPSIAWSNCFDDAAISAALVSAGGSTIYGLGAPPGRGAWDVRIQNPLDARQTALTVALKDRALSIAGTSEKFFDADGVRYSHIMDPRTGRPVQGVLSVAVLASTGTAGDALDDAFFVMGVDGSPAVPRAGTGVEAMFFLPDPRNGWRMVRESR